MCDLANSIEGDLVMTYDTPSNNPEGMMPVLDMKVWMREDDCLKFRFYEKPMSAKVTVMRDSALPWLTKKVTMAGEISRRLLNTSRDLVEMGLADEDIDRFLYKLMRSGYSVDERTLIEKEGRARYENILRQVEGGMRPLYRNSDVNKYQREVVKLKKQINWYGKSNGSVLFVQATPGERLKSAVQYVCDKSGMKIKVVEKGGRTVKQILQKSDIDPVEGCRRDDCMICSTKGGGNCEKESVGYRVDCSKCEEDGLVAVMHGETGRSARIRVGEHHKALMKKKDSNLWEHCCKEHGGQMVPFNFQVTKVFREDPLSRQLDEAIRIQREEGVLLNDKNEWTRPAGYAISVTRM